MAGDVQRASGAQVHKLHGPAQTHKADKAHAVVNDPRPELDHVSLAIGSEGSPVQTATRAQGVKDVEVNYRKALREFLRSGADFKGPEKALADSGVAAKEIAKIQAEEAGSYFRMAKDEFVRSMDEHNQLSGAFSQGQHGELKGHQQMRLDDLKNRARSSFDGAVRADQMLGGLDPQRGRDLEAMEAILLRVGFPKDEIKFDRKPVIPVGQK